MKFLLNMLLTTFLSVINIEKHHQHPQSLLQTVINKPSSNTIHIDIGNLFQKNLYEKRLTPMI